MKQGDGVVLDTTEYMININMRCIETAIYDFFATDKYRLTLTWDVLKQYRSCCYFYLWSWLTLTWDVLKQQKS